MTFLATIFDGRRIAGEKEIELEEEVKRLKGRGITPKLVSILIGKDKASKQFLSLKKKAAERVGVELQVEQFRARTSLNELTSFIEKLNKDKGVHGVMLQLPLPKKFSVKDRDLIINEISPGKDVDGMRENSKFLAPVVKAVLAAIKESSRYIVRRPLKVRPYKARYHMVPGKVVVVGVKGFVGGKIVRVLEEMGYEIKGVDIDTKNLSAETKKADILICATGREGLIRGDIVKGGSVVIDVGAPRGDVLFEEVVEKVSFVTPVPGGIGPVTISFLLENLVEAAKSGIAK